MYMLIHTYAYTYLDSVPFQVHFEKKKQLNVSLMNLYVGTILCTPQDAPSVNAYPSADTSQAPKSPNTGGQNGPRSHKTSRATL